MIILFVLFVLMLFPLINFSGYCVDLIKWLYINKYIITTSLCIGRAVNKSGSRIDEFSDDCGCSMLINNSSYKPNSVSAFILHDLHDESLHLT